MTRTLLALAFGLLAGCNGDATTDGGVDSSSPHDLGLPDATGMDAPSCPDADGDGHTSLACGGDDCDDADATRYPGNVETCDSAGHDEDCDPTTLGPDADHDGAAYWGCCNDSPSGARTCGDDCDDARATVGPSAIESCNGVDDDCDGRIDEDVATVVCHDGDGDGYGDLASASSGCRIGVGETTICNDCDDHDASIHPGQFEACQGVDDDCNGVVDDGCACTTGDTQPCGSTVGGCAVGTQHCMGGVWPSACSGATLPALEVCDGVDDDCDGMVDEGLTHDFVADCDGDGYGDDAMRVQRCSAPSAAPPSCARGVWTATGGDCDDRDAARFPGHGCSGLDGGVPDGGGGGSSDAVAVTATQSFMCALRSPGTVACWGNDTQGQLARGYTSVVYPTLPEPVVMLSDAMAIDSAQDHVCVLRAGGIVSCWGNDDPLTAGPAISSVTPTDTGLTGIGVATGNAHTCVLDAAGTVRCFGHDDSGQLGSGTVGSGGLTLPGAAVTVVGLSDAVEISAQGNFTCARRAGGSVVCWGVGNLGQLGDGTTTMSSATPVAVTGVADAVQLAAGHDFACARRATGGVVCWGSDVRAELGDGPGAGGVGPVDVVGLTDATQLTAGWAHACARRATGGVVCWGAADDGQLATGSTADASVPTAVLGADDATDVFAGGFGTCVRHASGSIACSGRNDWGQLGDGTLASSATLLGVTLP